MDDDALTALVRRELPRLVAMLRFYREPGLSADEIAADAVLRLCRHWPRVSRMDHPEAWLYRVALNLGRRAAVRERHRRIAGTLWARQQSAEANTVDWVDAGPISTALLTLPNRQREAVICRFYLDLSVETTADVMHCAPGTVRALTAQAVSTLRQMMNTTTDPR